MSEVIEVEKGSDWKRFMRKHWSLVAIFIVAGILLIAGAVYVFWWFVGDAQSTALVPSILSLWTMNNMLMFVLHLIFWEVLAIGIPIAILGVAGWQWWKRLPLDEKNAYHRSGKHSRARDGGSGISFLFTIAFVIKVYVDGNWNVPVGTWSLDYVVGSMITILVWVAVIFGIPLAIVGIWWISRGIGKKTV
jgi:Sec-independent protein secretion pathway component TatC